MRRVDGRTPFFFFNDTATTEIYTLSLHDALPICWGLLQVLAGMSGSGGGAAREFGESAARVLTRRVQNADRKSTRLNSSHTVISYAVFCLKKKKRTTTQCTTLQNTWSTVQCKTR